MTMTQPVQALDRSSKIVLGIDDSPEMQKLLQAIICHAGYVYVGASGGNSALAEITARNPFSAILLDVEMPGIDGFATCTRIRKHTKGETVPVAFLTFYNKVTDFEKCKAAGGNDFIVKPFTGKTLIERLDRWSSQLIGTPRAL
jgi:two-component system, sensor histidine kinase and response regulator